MMPSGQQSFAPRSGTAQGETDTTLTERPFYNGYNPLPYSQLQTVMLVQVKVHFYSLLCVDS